MILAMAACDTAADPPPTGVGTIEVSVVTQGLDLDVTGYAVTANGVSAAAIPTNGSASFTRQAGVYEIDLADVQSNCALEGSAPTVTLAGDQVVLVTLSVTCMELPALRDRIVWFRQQAIVLARPDMSDFQELVVAGTLRWGLAVSPDGKWVAFTDRIGNRPDVMVSTSNGDAPWAAVQSDYIDQLPAFTHDGRLLFVSHRIGNRASLFATDIYGAQPVLVAEEVHHPDVSPDGTRIVFASTRRAGFFDIYVMSIDGTDVQAVTGGDVYESEPSWSPDGSRIAFVSGEGDSIGVFTIDPDGNNLTAVTSGAEWDAEPRWSPDGQQIIFSRRIAPGNWDVFRIDVDGGNEVNLTGSNLNEAGAIWLP